MTIDTLKAHRRNPEELAATLSENDIAFLMPLLSEKDDDIRYPAYLTLCARSKTAPDVYPYWDVFVEKLDDENSYQRNIGATLLGLNVRWDGDKKFSSVFKRFIAHFTDEKFITSRLVIQTVPDWAKYVPELLADTAEALMGIDILSLKETQRKLILTDIMNALIAIRAVRPSDQITDYLMKALTGSVFDKKTVRQFESKL